MEDNPFLSHDGRVIISSANNSLEDWSVDRQIAPSSGLEFENEFKIVFFSSKILVYSVSHLQMVFAGLSKGTFNVEFKYAHLGS